MDPLFQLIYTSTASKTFKAPDIVNILEAARVKNASLDITGMLLFADGDFLQVLEGPKANVRALYATIQADSRHAGILMLFDREIAARNFVGWSMGFETVDRDNTLNDLFDISRGEVEARMTDERKAAVMAFLVSFYQVTTRQVL